MTSQKKMGIENNPAYPAERQTPLILKAMLGISVFSLIFIQVLNSYRPETFMSENKLLSDKFTESYDGPPFDIMRVRCGTKRLTVGNTEYWTISYRKDGHTVNFESMSGLNPCLVYAGKKPSYALLKTSYAILKNTGNPLGFTVMTTGEEEEEAYKLELVEKLLSASISGNKELKRQQEVNSSWKTTQQPYLQSQ